MKEPENRWSILTLAQSATVLCGGCKPLNFAFVSPPFGIVLDEAPDAAIRSQAQAFWGSLGALPWREGEKDAFPWVAAKIRRRAVVRDSESGQSALGWDETQRLALAIHDRQGSASAGEPWVFAFVSEQEPVFDAQSDGAALAAAPAQSPRDAESVRLYAGEAGQTLWPLDVLLVPSRKFGKHAETPKEIEQNEPGHREAARRRFGDFCSFFKENGAQTLFADWQARALQAEVEAGAANAAAENGAKKDFEAAPENAKNRSSLRL